MEGLEGLEPSTCSLEGCCSIQLSYRPKAGRENSPLEIYFQMRKRRTFPSLPNEASIPGRNWTMFHFSQFHRLTEWSLGQDCPQTSTLMTM